jgi:hypothetical protein
MKQYSREHTALYRLRHPEKIKAEQERYSRLRMWRKYYYGNLELQRKRRREYMWKKARKLGIPLRSELVGPRNHNWKGGPKRCLDCGINVASRSKATKRCFPCAHRQMRGSNSVAWKGGHTSFRKFLYGTTEYRRWRRQIFQRDNYICQMCCQRGGKLEAHHIKRMIVIIREVIPNPSELPGCKVRDLLMDYKPLWDTSNGITLCKPCHRKESRHDKKIIQQALQNLHRQ